MAHANAALTPKHRLRLARLIVEDGWPPSRAAEFFHVSPSAFFGEPEESQPRVAV